MTPVATIDYTQISVAREGVVSIITLDRPEKLNAWTPRMAEEQVQAIQAANDDPTIGAIVMTGAGRGFCAGADMEATFRTRIEGSDPGNDTAGGVGGMPAGLDWVSFLRASKPIVCAVNGAAVGIGVTMCLPADQIVASTAAKFGMGFIKMGLVPELASTRLLAARVGFGRASDLFLSGRLISGTEAHAIGLADRLAEPAELLATALATANSYAANPDLQLRMTKQLLTENVVDTDLRAIQRREQALLAECWKSAEHKEAVAAFIEKRPAVFRPASDHQA
ncbi:MAG TPA: enoyl-CoA hydratase-related protein [Ilumatobacteraceae bacterium]|jgi:enoyl-CoA hydratase/carnithine racemase|nr:enoyl-CoA hydratase-related protein [Ilumatobacteraceae bacterium]